MQIATGWEASVDGPVLLSEPEVGTYVIDLVQNISRVNGHEAELTMRKLLGTWLDGELGRLGRDRGWLTSATVEVAYELVPSDVVMDSNQDFWTSQAFVAKLRASASVVTKDGSAEASFTNLQATIGKRALPGRPMPEGYPPSTGEGRPVQIKRKPRGNRPES